MLLCHVELFFSSVRQPSQRLTALHVRDAVHAQRARRFARGTAVRSTRGFVTHTGTFRGVPVSIIATGMGYPMMDFVVRETRAVVNGPMAMLRYVYGCIFLTPSLTSGLITVQCMFK